VIVDTSAIIAILTEEDDAAVYAGAIAAADVRRLSAASYLECGIVLDSQRDPIISRSLDELTREANFTIEPVTEHQARLARQAYADFGKGSGHPAGLNFGDCLSYALAVDLREPLLWKGDDFGHTGIRSALDQL
jgi:ribonuclease VapC